VPSPALDRTAWEITAGPALVYGPGTNKLPMVHVDDLAAYIAAAASEEVRWGPAMQMAGPCGWL